jgi:acyl carrier protein
MSEIRERTVKVISETCGVPADQLAGVDRFNDLAQWDSLMQLNLILNLEKEFGVQFDIGEITSWRSISDVSATLARRQV